MLEISPATINQIRSGRGGRVIEIQDDVACIARDLKDVHEDVRLGFNERGGYFVVYQLDREPATGAVMGEHIVTTWDPEVNGELDQRLVQRVRRISQPDYSVADDLDRMDREVEREHDRRFSEQVGEKAELLAHAIRKDLGATNRIFVPEDIRRKA